MVYILDMKFTEVRAFFLSNTLPTNSQHILFCNSIS